MKVCKVCKEEKEDHWFYLCSNRTNKQYYDKTCTECRNIKNRERRRMKRAQWKLILKSQDGKCKICGKVITDYDVCVDHDHKTGVVRGLLCRKCNLGLGYFDDNPETLRAATDYLENSKEIIQ